MVNHSPTFIHVPKKAIRNRRFVLTVNPVNFINFSKSLSSPSFVARTLRFSLVSHPLIVFAFAQRFRPCSDIGPVDLPPWNMHTCFPLSAAFWHCCLLRFDSAWYRGALIRLPNKVIWVLKLFRWFIDLSWRSFAGPHGSYAPATVSLGRTHNKLAHPTSPKGSVVRICGYGKRLMVPSLFT